MNVLFLMFAFPDMSRSFNMYTTIVEEFVKHGHNVHVVAPELHNLRTGIRKEKGIEILRVKTLPIKDVPNYLKGLSNILIPHQYSRALRKHYPAVKFDLIIVPTPPVTLVKLAATLKRKHAAKVYLILRDIFPQNAVDLRFMRKGGIIHRYFRRMEKKLYRVADQIGCMSKANVEYILEHNPSVDEKKVHILENYQKLYDTTSGVNHSIKEKYGLEDKFIAVFGGNMGKPQQLENVLLLAKACEAYDDVIFLLLGDGVQKRQLELEIGKNNSRNIRVISTIPKHDYQKLLQVCDLGLISLHKDFTIPNIPSKTLDYFNVGLPVLASIDRATDYRILLEEAEAGLWSFAGDHVKFKLNFDRLYSDPLLRNRMGSNGRKYFEKNLTPDKAYDVIVKNVKQCCL